MPDVLESSANEEPGKLLRYLRLTRAAVILLYVEVAKTVRQPERLVAVPYHFLLRLADRHLPRAFPWPGRLNSSEVEKARIAKLADTYAQKGDKLLDAGEPEAAWEALRRCIEISTEPVHFFAAALCLIHGQGRYKESLNLFAHANVLRRNKARTLKLTNSPIRYLDRTWAGSFGHIAEIDYPIKLGILEGRPNNDTLLYVPPDVKVPNRFLLEQWRSHLTLIERETDLPLPPNSLDTLSFDFRGPLLADGSTAHYWEAASKTYRHWHAQNRGPVLRFPEDVAHRGRMALEKAGIPAGAWYVALHVREAASKNHHSALHDVLNARIADYLPAIEEITRRGGWVIRMGDPTMTPLAPMPNVLDYCHSDIRSDWMDIFLFAKARFYIGTSSGPAYVPPLYSVPCVLTNWWPPAQRPWHPQDIFVPKLYRRLSDKTYLTLSETLAEPFGYCNSLDYLNRRHGVVVEDNTPADIHAAVCEMFAQLEGMIKSDFDDLELEKRANVIYESNSGYGMATISRDFLRSHRELLN